MLKHLQYSVCFPSTGRTLEGNVDFQPGMGAITGPNEAGKSFIIEMVRFCLFGTSALRGTSDDYKKLTACLSFVVRDSDYKVDRTISSARLLRGDTEIAVGVRAVNLKIVEVLGFGLEVFDATCVANQGDIEKLGSMKPAERKRMVDSVIGLTVIDDMAKWASDEATALAREAEAITRTVAEPIRPERPADYKRSEKLRPQIDELIATKSELDRLEGFLEHNRHEPVMPTTKVGMDADILKGFSDDQDVIRAQAQAIKLQLLRMPDASPYTGEQLDAFEQQYEAFDLWLQRERYEKLYPAPTLSLEEIQKKLKDLVLLSAWKERKEIEKQLEHALSHGEHECPACHHKWPVSGDQVSALKDHLSKLPVLDEPLHPGMTAAELEEQKHRHASRETEQWECLKDILKVTRPGVAREDIGRWRTSLAEKADRARLTLELESLHKRLADQPDFKAMYEERRRYEEALQEFQIQHIEYNTWLAERSVKLVEAKKLAQKVTQLPSLQQLLELSTAYERDLVRYEIEWDRYNLVQKEAAALKAKADDWRKAKAALLRLRSLVKQHLVPSLNRVASHLLTGMTGGQRNQVVVDEEFDISVDGQPLDTLSGSGKAVANLALRIALGRVLTDNVMSIFIGDEIDASMDEERAGQTANILQNLSDSISQILIVTHKCPLADYHISLGQGNELSRLH